MKKPRSARILPGLVSSFLILLLEENRQVEGVAYMPNRLVNFAFLSSTENKKLGGVAPGKYRSKLPKNAKDILDAALCPEVLFEDDYKKVIVARSKLLTEFAKSLI